MNTKNKIQNKNNESSLFSAIKSMRGQDYFRLQWFGINRNLPPHLRDAIDHLYVLNFTQRLIATVLDSIASFHQSVFLLSLSDCQRLLDQNPKIDPKFSIKSGAGHRAYAGMIAELEKKQHLIKVRIVSKTKPMLVEVVNPDLLNLIGESSLEWKKAVHDSLGLPENSDLSSQNPGLRPQGSDLSSQISVFSTQGKRVQDGDQVGAQDRAQEDDGF